jgi:hypothetical protein
LSAPLRRSSSVCFSGRFWVRLSEDCSLISPAVDRGSRPSRRHAGPRCRAIISSPCPVGHLSVAADRLKCMWLDDAASKSNSATSLIPALVHRVRGPGF